MAKTLIWGSDLYKGFKLDRNKLLNGAIDDILPFQMLTLEEKTTDWIKAVADYYETAGWNNVERKAGKMQRNYWMRYGKLNPSDYIINPSQNDYYKAVGWITPPESMSPLEQFYPLAPNFIDVLRGEFIKRENTWAIQAIDDQSVGQMFEYKNSQFKQILMEHAQLEKQQALASMGLTAEAVATQYGISRLDQDTFSYNSHVKALAAIESGKFKDEIVPVTVEEVYLQNNKRKTKSFVIDTDEGPRKETTVEGLAALKAVFAAKGSVTAGNSSQTSDGAAFVIVMSEKMVKELNIEPIARLVTSAVVGCEPRIMGIGPVVAIPRALQLAGLKLEDIDMIELNEAFAAQSLAVIRTLGLNPDIINPNGGAIALGHPLGCSGAKLSVQLINEMRRQNKRYGMVSACIGGGQGIAGIIERLK